MRMPWSKPQGRERGAESETVAAAKAIRARTAELLSTGPVTEQKLIKIVHPNAEPVCTDQFLNISKEAYPLPWLVREIVQNFIDANPVHVGTLEGVEFSTVDSIDGGKQFVIKGNWPFKSPTGLTALHSGKAHPGKTHLAGGNGIGLKQTVLRFLRDYGVERFSIQGEGWVVNYRLVGANEMNVVLDEREVPEEHRVENDWLLAEVEETNVKGECAYTVEISDKDVMAAMSDFANLGVSTSNEYLRDLDYESEAGGLKWLPQEEVGTPNRGRLFINGQVMNYKERGDTQENYWQGPEYVTLKLNDIEYQISIDRPAVKNLELKRHLEKLISSMHKEDLMHQLEKSEHLWSNLIDSEYGGDRLGCFVVIESIINQLRWSHNDYAQSEFRRRFGDKNYLCWNRGVSAGQVKELEKQGFVICPRYFEFIGMTKASTKLDSIDVAKQEKPHGAQHHLRKIAEEHGLPVGHEDFSKLAEVGPFIEATYRRLKDQIVSVEEREDMPGTIRIQLKTNFSQDVLFHPLHNPKNEEQKTLHLLRGIAYHGLHHRFFKDLFISQGEYVTTFGLQYDDVTQEDLLLARNVKSSSDKGVFIEFELDDEAQELFKQRFLQSASEETEVFAPPAEPASDVAPDARVAGVAAVPVEQPPAPEGVQPNVGRVIQKEVQLTPEQLEKRIPDLQAAISQLQGLVPEAISVEPGENDPIQQYLMWRNSGDFYGQAGGNAGYLTGRHLIEILAEQNQAVIDSIQATDTLSSEISQLQLELKALINSISPAEDQVDEFEIVLNPSENQMAQMGLLRNYNHLVTGTALPNDLFLYRGTGSKGINISKKAIGLHESLFKVSFTEALSTFTHEIAHNFSMNHDPAFMHSMQSLFVTMISKLSKIAAKADSGEPLTEEEKVIIEIQSEWEQLQAA